MSVNVMTKENKRILAVFIIVTAVYLILVGFSLVLSVIDGGIFNKVGIISESNFDLVGDIKIDSKEGDIEIVGGDVDDISVKVSGDLVCSNIEVGQDDSGTVFIESKDDDFWSLMCHRFHGADIEVIVPDYYSRAVTINNEVGDISVSSAGALVINNDVGEITVGKVAKSFEISNNIGEIEIEDANVMEDSSIKNKIGEITIKKMNPTLVEAKTSVGGVNIERHYAGSGAVVKIENSIGSIDISN